MSKSQITMYTTSRCGDCRRAKQFLKERGVEFSEVNIEESPEAEALVMQANDDLEKVPTFEVDGRFFSCSPFNPIRLSEELRIPLNL